MARLSDSPLLHTEKDEKREGASGCAALCLRPDLFSDRVISVSSAPGYGAYPVACGIGDMVHGNERRAASFLQRAFQRGRHPPEARPAARSAARCAPPGQILCGLFPPEACRFAIRAFSSTGIVDPPGASFEARTLRKGSRVFRQSYFRAPQRLPPWSRAGCKP